MVNVRFYTNKGMLCLRVEGHAQAAPKGEDVVCAGASVLAATLADFVTLMNAHGELEKEPYIKMDTGIAVVKVKPKPESRGKLLLSFSVIATGLSAMVRNYPDYIQLKLFDKSAIEDFSK